MSNEAKRLSARQLGALALTAAEVPAFRVCAGLSWPWVLLGGGCAAALLSVLAAGIDRKRTRAEPALCGEGGARRFPPEGPTARRAHRRLFAAAAAVLLFAAAALAAWEAARAFPETAESPLAAALVLLPALAAARRGPEAAGRCAGVLLWVTGALCGAVLLFSLPGLRSEWLRPTGGPEQAVRAFAALLLPGAALGLAPALAPGDRLPRWPWWSAAALAAAAAAVTGGILSPALARQPEAFRTLAVGVSVLGVIRRFEALVNGAMLMAGFCLSTLFLSVLGVAGGILDGFGKKEKNPEKSEKKA